MSVFCKRASQSNTIFLIRRALSWTMLCGWPWALLSRDNQVGWSCRCKL